MNSRIKIIFAKEVIDNLRDRRSVLSALLTPLFMPTFLVALIIVVGKTMFVDPVEKPLILPVQGAENAPGLVVFLQQHGVDVQTASSNLQAQVRDGTYAVALVIPPEYSEAVRSGKMASLDLIVDSSRQSAAVAIERTRSLLQAYSQQLGAMRLLARGINPDISSPLNISQTDTATPQSQTLIFLNMMPFLIIMTIFLGGMYVIIDTTAGERERGSLEPLLINPATREEFVLGKLLASLPFATATLIITLAAFWIAFNVIPLERYTHFPITLSFSTLWSIFWISLPMILLASGLQIVVATFTKSFKEAQTYLGILPLIAGLPGAFLTFLPVKATVWTMLIPAFGQSILINQVMRGEPIRSQDAIIAALVTLGLALSLTWVAIKLYQRETILLGR